MIGRCPRDAFAGVVGCPNLPASYAADGTESSERGALFTAGTAAVWGCVVVGQRLRMRPRCRLHDDGTLVRRRLSCSLLCPVGTVRGQGTHLWSLEDSEAPLSAVHVSRDSDTSAIRMCESVEAGHSDHTLYVSSLCHFRLKRESRT